MSSTLTLPSSPSSSSSHFHFQEYSNPKLASQLLENNPNKNLLNEEDILCPVTCAFLPASLDVCILGQGPYLKSSPLFYDNPHSHGTKTNGQGFRCKIFENDSGSVHGLRFLSLVSSSFFFTRRSDNDNEEEKETSKLDLGLAFGGRNVALFHTDYKNIINPIQIVHNHKILKTMQCSDWIWDVAITEQQQQQTSSSSSCIIMTLAFMNNSCELWKITPMQDTSKDEVVLVAQQLRKVTCETRCITYSMTFFTPNDDEEVNKNNDNVLTVASGTVFNEILLWRIPPDESESRHENDLNHVNDKNNNNVQVDHRLIGHEGVIFKVRFHQTSKNEKYIASTSDDRTVRLWKHNNGDGGEKSNNGTYVPLWIGFGHTARVWDVVFTSYGIVTSGEDGTARLWDTYTGKQLVELKGHACQAIWGVVTDPSGQIATTFGNDGCAKVWDLESHLILNKARNIVEFEGANEKTEIGLEYKLLPLDEDIVPGWSKPNVSDKNKDTKEEETQNGTMKKKKKAVKPKIHKQIIAGMSFYSSSNDTNQDQQKVLFATRAGGLFSLHISSYRWEIHEPWLPSNTDTCSSTNSSVIPTASCIAIHPKGNVVAVGTTGKNIVLSPIMSSLNSGSDAQLENSFKHVVLEVPGPFYSIQKLSWLNEKFLIVFHIKGILILWKFSSSAGTLSCDNNEAPSVQMVLNMEASNGVPMSFSHDQVHQRLIVGDSRGNLAVFDINPLSLDDHDTDNMKEHKPIYMIKGAHKKEHITSVIYDPRNDIVLSVGNDGILHEWSLPKDSLSIDQESYRHKRLSLPISSLTALTHIWLAPHENGEQSIIVGGYYGHKFIIFDITKKYVLLQVETGGRQRINDFTIDFRNSGFHFPHQHAFVFSVARKDGKNEVNIHRSSSSDKCRISRSIDSITKQNLISKDFDNNVFQYSIGNSFHGDTVNDACWCETSTPGRALLLSGSNDCTVRLSIFEKNALSCVKELPPHESCVRAVTSSSHSGSTSSLLVTCGGKLSMSFYLLEDDETGNHDGSTIDGTTNLSVHYLCSNRHLLSKRPRTIDQRINAVKAIPLKCCPGTHLVFSGDSDGTFQLIIVNEDIHGSKQIRKSHIFCTNSRPILSIDVVDLYHTVLVFIGNSAGDVCIWEVPNVSSFCLDNENKQDIKFPASPLFVYKAHQMGTNGLSAMATSDTSLDHKKAKKSIVICSGGDDQAITTALLSFYSSSTDGETGSIMMLRCERMNEASSSAIKSVKIMKNQNEDFRLYVVGYDQRLALWKVNTNQQKKTNKMLHFLSSSNAHVSDVSGLNCMTLNEANGSKRELCVVVGQGAHIFSLDLSIPIAAEALLKANFLLVTAGAGASCDSGLATYDSMPEKYREMCNPILLVQKCEEFQQFWLDFAHLYSRTKPHSGYSILDRWCSGGMLKNLRRNSCNDIDAEKNRSTDPFIQSSAWWIYTSNVDGHFRQFHSFRHCICEIHGVANEFRCASATGLSEGKERHGSDWKEWNRKVNKSQTKQCEISLFDVNNDTSCSALVCKHCKLPARPNVLMFHDSDANILQSIDREQERYQAWEARIENQVVLNYQNLVILEVGCGKAVPAVRNESEEVLFDCLSRIKSKEGKYNSDGRARVTLIRINPNDADIENDTKDMYSSTISVYDNSLGALSSINKWISILNSIDES